MACSWMLDGLFHPSDAAASASCVQIPKASNDCTALLCSSSVSCFAMVLSEMQRHRSCMHAGGCGNQGSSNLMEECFVKLEAQ